MSNMDWSAVFDRPADEDLVPCIIQWRSGGSVRDYISAGLAAAEDVRNYLRKPRPAERILQWDPRTIIRYNKESGSLDGLASGGIVNSGYGVETSGTAPATLGEPLRVILCTDKAWKSIKEHQPCG